MLFIQSVTSRKLTAQDVETASIALDLLNRTQGNGLFGPDYLQRRILNPDSLVIAAFHNQELVGIGVAEIIDDFDYYRPFDSNLPSELADKIVGSFTALSVLERHQGRGIGRLLSHKRLEWLIGRKCDVALGVSWVSGLGGTSDRTFESAGFKAIRRLDDFYHASSIEKPFDCPGCHAIPCKCGAILYRRNFSY